MVRIFRLQVEVHPVSFVSLKVRINDGLHSVLPKRYLPTKKIYQLGISNAIESRRISTPYKGVLLKKIICREWEAMCRKKFIVLNQHIGVPVTIKISHSGIYNDRN
jgi:hypothetical protein